MTFSKRCEQMPVESKSWVQQLSGIIIIIVISNIVIRELPKLARFMQIRSSMSVLRWGGGCDTSNLQMGCVCVKRRMLV